MTHQEFTALASPPCHECEAPIRCVEMPWHMDEDGKWRLGPCHAICANKHRVLVEPF